jgi:hypothetical protein
MGMESHGGMITTRKSPDSSTRALWQLYLQSHLLAKQEEHGEGMLNFAYEVSLLYL